MHFAGISKSALSRGFATVSRHIHRQAHWSIDYIDLIQQRSHG
jgi:hypothetical protein